MIVVSKILLIRHLCFTTCKGYSLQLFLASLITLTSIFSLDEYLIIVLALITVVISFLSQLTHGLFRILIRGLLLLQLWYTITFSFKLAILIIIVQITLIYIYISYSFRIDFALLSSSKRGYSPRGILKIFIEYLINNKMLVLLLATLTSIITYFGQSILTNIQELPVLMVFYINLITVLEVLIGSRKEEIMIDRARTETLLSSSIVPSFKRFESSSIYLISLTLISICTLGLGGIVLNTSNITILLKNLFSIPVIILVGFVYLRKTELLNSGHEYNLLKLTLPILMVILITIFSLTSQ
ncbi:hypothetical protein GGQ92_001154 [Gracilibacillus halotolerans]|uniref:Uncharacterized protein n=1 Tax=Gracilibacillus halotolerans TaxID=74386 RepID=A0A841RI80_9BACI|nr:hypothetical protein [Gracilibacillus halotolerans]